MARKQGGVNKFLNFIGLVDEEEPRRGAQLDYEDSYGRPSTYVPQQQRSRTEDTRAGLRVRHTAGQRTAHGQAQHGIEQVADQRTYQCVGPHTCWRKRIE